MRHWLLVIEHNLQSRSPPSREMEGGVEVSDLLSPSNPTLISLVTPPLPGNHQGLPATRHLVSIQETLRALEFPRVLEGFRSWAPETKDKDQPYTP